MMDLKPCPICGGDAAPHDFGARCRGKKCPMKDIPLNPDYWNVRAEEDRISRAAQSTEDRLTAELAEANKIIKHQGTGIGLLNRDLKKANGLLDEVQDLCKVQENFPFRGHLEDILAKRNQGKDGGLEKRLEEK